MAQWLLVPAAVIAGSYAAERDEDRAEARIVGRGGYARTYDFYEEPVHTTRPNISTSQTLIDLRGVNQDIVPDDDLPDEELPDEEAHDPYRGAPGVNNLHHNTNDHMPRDEEQLTGPQANRTQHQVTDLFNKWVAKYVPKPDRPMYAAVNWERGSRMYGKDAEKLVQQALEDGMVKVRDKLVTRAQRTEFGRKFGPLLDRIPREWPRLREQANWIRNWTMSDETGAQIVPYDGSEPVRHMSDLGDAVKSQYWDDMTAQQEKARVQTEATVRETRRWATQATARIRRAANRLGTHAAKSVSQRMIREVRGFADRIENLPRNSAGAFDIAKLGGKVVTGGVLGIGTTIAGQHVADRVVGPEESVAHDLVSGGVGGGAQDFLLVFLTTWARTGFVSGVTMGAAAGPAGVVGGAAGAVAGTATTKSLRGVMKDADPIVRETVANGVGGVNAGGISALATAGGLAATDAALGTGLLAATGGVGALLLAGVIGGGAIGAAFGAYLGSQGEPHRDESAYGGFDFDYAGLNRQWQQSAQADLAQRVVQQQIERGVYQPPLDITPEQAAILDEQRRVRNAQRLAARQLQNALREPSEQWRHDREVGRAMSTNDYGSFSNAHLQFLRGKGWSYNQIRSYVRGLSTAELGTLIETPWAVRM